MPVFRMVCRIGKVSVGVVKMASGGHRADGERDQQIPTGPQLTVILHSLPPRDLARILHGFAGRRSLGGTVAARG
jgi:hypothetical protein